MPNSAVSNVVVVGSANMDLVGRASRLPGPGETVIGGEFSMHPGGKGANQAVASARLGARTWFVGCIGSDTFGESLARSLQESGVNTSRMRIADSSPTGIALIGVDEASGENSIIVLPGANSALSKADIDSVSDLIASASVVVCSLEAPLATIQSALRLAKKCGVTTVVNPAPAIELSPGDLRCVSVLTPNEHEVGILARNSSADPETAARALVALGVGCVIVTLGARGALIVDHGGGPTKWVAAAAVDGVVDTTAAGDCFTGALAVALSEGNAVTDAVAFANSAAAISVTRRGAQESLPWRSEVDEKLSANA